MKQLSTLATAFMFVALTQFTHLCAAEKGVDSADVNRWSTAWNSHDIDKVADLFSSDAVIDQPSNPKPLNSVTLRPFFKMIFTAYPDFHVTVVDAVISGRKLVTIEEVSGHWRGSYTDPSTHRTLKANGRAFEHSGAMYIVYNRNRKIKLLRIFWDRLVVDQQLGVTP